jgi:transcriptional regulator with XRE-family HTH domain
MSIDNIAPLHNSVSRVVRMGCGASTLGLVPIQWEYVRRELGKLRTARRRDSDGKPWTLADLSEASGVDKATIHRTENTKRYPTYKPDLDTMERWTVACGVPLSAFLARIESLQNESLHGRIIPPHNPQAPPSEISKGLQHGGGRALSTETAATIPEEDVRTFLRVLRDALGGSIVAAIERAQQIEQPAPGPRTRRARRHKAG